MALHFSSLGRLGEKLLGFAKAATGSLPDARTTQQRLHLLEQQIPRLLAETTAVQSALRHLKRDMEGTGGMAISPTVTNNNEYFGFRVDPQVSVVREVAQRRTVARSLNRLPRLSDWSVSTRLTDIMTMLGEPHTVHRKMWEYAMCVDVMEKMGVAAPDACAIGVGAGSERPLFHYANVLRKMVATDLYDNPQHEGHPDMLTSPEKFAPFVYKKDNLEVLRMGGDDLSFPDGEFDFAFCLSSIEHFGSRDVQRKAFEEMIRVVRPGGAICIITEVILNGTTHNEYFTPSEIHDMFLTNPSVALYGGPIELEITDAQLACAIDIRNEADLKVGPHVLLTDGTVLWTSLSLFFRRL